MSAALIHQRFPPTCEPEPSPRRPRVRAWRFAAGVAFFLTIGLALPQSSAPVAATALGTQTFDAFTAQVPFGWSSAIADFDSDGLPDIAAAHRIGSAGSARYQLRVAISGREEQTVTFSSTQGALAIRAVDVDNDRDLDVVVTPILGREVVGVWLNDGGGHFNASSAVPSLPLFAFTAQAPTIGVPFVVAGAPAPRRMHLAAARSVSNRAAPTADDTIPLSPPLVIIAPALFNLAPRPPPLSPPTFSL